MPRYFKEPLIKVDMLHDFFAMAALNLSSKSLKIKIFRRLFELALPLKKLQLIGRTLGGSAEP